MLMFSAHNVNPGLLWHFLSIRRQLLPSQQKDIEESHAAEVAKHAAEIQTLITQVHAQHSTF
jgi:hypothetical protein